MSICNAKKRIANPYIFNLPHCKCGGTGSFAERDKNLIPLPLVSQRGGVGFAFATQKKQS